MEDTRVRTAGGKLRFEFDPEKIKAARNGDREAFNSLLTVLYAKDEAILAWIKSQRRDWGQIWWERTRDAFHDRFFKLFAPDHEGEITNLGGLCVKLLKWALGDMDRKVKESSIDDNGGKDSEEAPSPTLIDTKSKEIYDSGKGTLSSEEVEQAEREEDIGELLKKVWQWTETLSPTHREILRRSAKGQKQYDIAEAMGIPPGTVAVVLSRTRDALRKKYRKNFDDLFVTSSRGH